MRTAIHAIRTVVVFLILAAIGVALDGFVGGAVAVFVASIALAGLPRRYIAVAGVASLCLAPLVVLAQGLPDESEVSALFVTDAMLAHHLVFAGFALLASWVVIDVRASMPKPTADSVPVSATASGSVSGTASGRVSSGEDPVELERRLSTPVACAVIGVVAALAIAASIAVVQV